MALNGVGAFALGVFAAAPELLSGMHSGLGGAQGHEGTALRTLGWFWIRRIRRIWSVMGFAVGEAGGRELFAVATAFDEGFFECGDLPVEEEVGLVDEADEGVGADGGVGVIQPVGVEGVALLV